MATKQFKIGLSDTDKQNMAQDVYERLLALTFPEYDTTETYAVGDFVVYNDQLYKCIGATSGAWDSTKWQLATLNDLLTDIEDAVAFVNDKANVDGNYPTLTAGLADNLTPYGEESGNEQTSPFISQGTATKNNTDIVTTGDYALFKEKQGNTVVVNQLFRNTTYRSGTAIIQGITLANVDGTLTINGTVTENTTTSLVTSDVSLTEGHKYLVYIDTKNIPSSGFQLLMNYGTYISNYNAIQASSSLTYFRLTCFAQVGTVFANSSLRCYVIDITSWEQSVIDDLATNPSHFSWYYNGDLSYNAGSLGNANGVKLVCTGRNIWDEEWEVGEINGATGATANTGSYIRSKNFIKVVPNNSYYCKTTQNIFIYKYDINKNYIGVIFTASNNSFDLDANCCFIKFATTSGGTTYNNDITISLYYTPEEGGEGYDKYYPYEEPYVVDTGSETLRQAGSVKDYKEPDGTIHRLVGVVDLGTLNWSNNGTQFFTNLVSLGIKPSVGSYGTNIVCAKYIANSANVNTFSHMFIDGTWINIFDVENTYADATAFKTAMSGVYLFFELATPTTEQGTQFAENLPINDYGMMYWLDSSNNLVGIPQGCKIFYPVNYKGFIDDAYLGASGSASNIITKNNYIKVWERSVSVDSYAGGDIAIENVSDYSFFIVFFDTNTADRPKHTEIVMNTSGRHTLQHTFSFTSDNVTKTGIACRDCTITNSGMTFGEGLVVVDNGETYNPNSMVIPNAVYGVKLGNGSGNEEE